MDASPSWPVLLFTLATSLLTGMSSKLASLQKRFAASTLDVDGQLTTRGPDRELWRIRARCRTIALRSALSGRCGERRPKPRDIAPISRETRDIELTNGERGSPRMFDSPEIRFYNSSPFCKQLNLNHQHVMMEMWRHYNTVDPPQHARLLTTCAAEFPSLGLAAGKKSYRSGRVLFFVGSC